MAKSVSNKKVGRPKGGRPKGGAAIKKENVTPMSITESLIETPVSNEEDGTKDSIKNAINEMLTGNLKNLPIWLENIGNDDPVKALTLFKDFSEYILPKQQRTDSKQDGTKPITINFEPASKMFEKKTVEVSTTDEKYIHK